MGQGYFEVSPPCQKPLAWEDRYLSLSLSFFLASFSLLPVLFFSPPSFHDFHFSILISRHRLSRLARTPILSIRVSISRRVPLRFREIHRQTAAAAFRCDLRKIRRRYAKTHRTRRRRKFQIIKLESTLNSSWNSNWSWIEIKIVTGTSVN